MNSWPIAHEGRAESDVGNGGEKPVFPETRGRDRSTAPAPGCNGRQPRASALCERAHGGDLTALPTLPAATGSAGEGHRFGRRARQASARKVICETSVYSPPNRCRLTNWSSSCAHTRCMSASRSRSVPMSRSWAIRLTFSTFSTQRLPIMATSAKRKGWLSNQRWGLRLRVTSVFTSLPVASGLAGAMAQEISRIWQGIVDYSGAGGKLGVPPVSESAEDG